MRIACLGSGASCGNSVKLVDVRWFQMMNPLEQTTSNKLQGHSQESLKNHKAMVVLRWQNEYGTQNDWDAWGWFTGHFPWNDIQGWTATCDWDTWTGRCLGVVVVTTAHLNGLFWEILIHQERRKAETSVSKAWQTGDLAQSATNPVYKV